MVRRVFVLELMLAAVAGAAGLTVEWRRYLGPRAVVGDYSVGDYSSVVCPDGMYYLADGRGAVNVVGPGGDILAHRTDIPEFAAGRLVACNAEGLLYVSGGRSGTLNVLDPGHGRDFAVVSRLEATVSIRNLVFGPGGRMFAAGARRGSDLPVHALNAPGRVLFSFGPPAPAGIVPRRPPDGFVFTLADGRVVFVERPEYLMRIYTAEGQAVGTRTRPVSSRRFTRFEVRGAAAFPEGGFAVCACNSALRMPGEPACVVDLYGPDAEFEGSVPSPAGGTLLAGGPDYTLYFTNVGLRDVTLVKAKIKKPGRGVYHADRARRTTLD